MTRLTGSEQKLLDAAEQLISVIRNVDDTRREYGNGQTEGYVLAAVEDGFTAMLADLESAIKSVRHAPIAPEVAKYRDSR